MPFKKGNKETKKRKSDNGGRNPDWFKHWCREAIHSDNRLKRINNILDNGEFEEFWPVWKYLSEVGYGKPSQSHEVKGTLTLEQLVCGEVDEKDDAEG